MNDFDITDFELLDLEILEDKFYTLFNLLVEKKVITRKEFIERYLEDLKSKKKAKK